MTGLNLWQIQKAIYEMLSANAPLQTLVSGIYDRVPERTEFPYIVLSDISATDWSCKTHTGCRASLIVHCFSQTRGNKQTASILESIRMLLHEATISIAGQHCIACRVENVSTGMDPDGKTQHGILKLSLLIQAIH